MVNRDVVHAAGGRQRRPRFAARLRHQMLLRRGPVVFPHRHRSGCARAALVARDRPAGGTRVSPDEDQSALSAEHTRTIAALHPGIARARRLLCRWTGDARGGCGDDRVDRLADGVLDRLSPGLALSRRGSRRDGAKHAGAVVCLRSIRLRHRRCRRRGGAADRVRHHGVISRLHEPPVASSRRRRGRAMLVSSNQHAPHRSHCTVSRRRSGCARYAA